MLAALVLASVPPRPALRSLPLPAKLAGGLFLFKTSVPAADKPFAGKLLVEAQQALRNDPRVTMELGAGLEAGGVFSSASSSHVGDDGEPERLMVLEFQVNGGNAWAQAVAFGVSRDAGESCVLVDLTIGGMEAAMTGGASLQVALPAAKSQSDG